MKEWICYAYVSPSGAVMADSQFESHDHAWKVALGWPDAQEISEAKQRGARIIKVRVTEVFTEDSAQAQDL